MGSDLLNPPDQGPLAGRLVQPVGVDLGRGSAPGRNGRGRRGGGSSPRRRDAGARGAAVGPRVLRGLRASGAVDRISKDSDGVAAAISVDRGAEVVGSMGDNAEKAGGMRSRRVGAAQKGRHLTRSRQAFGGGFRKAVDEPVGTPVSGREHRPIAEQDIPDGMVRLVGGHPDEVARAHEHINLAIGSVGNHAPDPSQRSIVVSGAGGASGGRGEEGLAVGADGGDEGAVDENLKKRPGFSRRSSVAPRRWPAEAIGKQVTLGGDSSDAKARAPDGSPFTIDEGAIAVPRDVLLASGVLGEGDNPGERASRLPERDGDPDSEQPMELEVPEPAVRNLVPHETRSGRRGGPAIGGAGAAA